MSTALVLTSAATEPLVQAPAAAPALSRTTSALIVLSVLGISAAVGRRNAPDPSHPGTRRWYKRLDKPSYTPPDAVFGAVWPVLETGLAVGGYRLLRQPAGQQRTRAVALWAVNSAMVGGWTEIFFRKHALRSSAVVAGTMVATGGAYVAVAAKADRPAALLGVPFVGWLGFATLLASRISARNPGPRT